MPKVPEMEIKFASSKSNYEDDDENDKRNIQSSPNMNVLPQNAPGTFLRTDLLNTSNTSLMHLNPIANPVLLYVRKITGKSFPTTEIVVVSKMNVYKADSTVM